jgi:hypothetical protein
MIERRAHLLSSRRENMPDAIREVFTHEAETISSASDAVIREITLRLTTADSSYAGTNAGVMLKLCERVFLLEAGLGHEMADGADAPQNASHDEFERAQTNLFRVQGKGGSLGIMLEQLRDTEITLSHDTKGATSDWNLDKIELSVSYEDKDKRNQFYKTWAAVGWLTDDAPTVLLQRGVARK